MPGWHARTKDLVADGELQVFGIAPEQYGDRMALFLQWKEMDFPVLMDPLNVLGVAAVPITLLVDPQGVIRYRNPKAADLATFLATDYPISTRQYKLQVSPPQTRLTLAALQSRKVVAVQEAIATYRKLIDSGQGEPTDQFQLGVLYRWLYDHDSADSGQFQKAIDCWQAALQEVPGQYIWRRRIQQYGPRLDKPYPFYNWVTEARKDIVAREETPFPLTVEPSGSEVAAPSRKNEQAEGTNKFPDLNNKLPNTDSALAVSVTSIPHTDRKDVKRLHLRLQPTGHGHWSSDAQEVELWLLRKDGEPILLVNDASPLTNGEDTSTEARTLETDLSAIPSPSAQLILFFSLCEKKEGVCKFLKMEIPIHEEEQP